MKHALGLSFRFLRRDWRAGELTTVGIALTIAVASITAVGFFNDRVRRSMEQHASELLAADLVVLSQRPVAIEWIKAARQKGLRTALTTQLPSVVVAGTLTQLVEIKAVSDGYPLRGRLKVTLVPYTKDHVTNRVPARGSVWLDARLMSQLNLKIGDSITIGAAKFAVSRIISYEPDRGGNFFSIAPRAMIHANDLQATKLVQTGSLISYRLLLAGDSPSIRSFRNWVKPLLRGGSRLQGLRDARPQLRVVLDRANQFLGLSALVSVVLAGVAIAISARHYASRHLDPSAILRCLGASQNFIIAIHGWQLLWLAIAGSLLGVLIGYAAQWILALTLVDLLVARLPPPGWKPALMGMVTGLVILMGFSLPPILRLRNVPPARVLRRDLGNLPRSSLSVYVFAVLTVIMIMLWLTGDVLLTIYITSGSVATLLVMGLVSSGLIRVVGRLRNRVGIAWRFGISNIARRPRASMAQLLAFGLGIMVMLLLNIVRNDLVDQWQSSLPPDAPNYFVINVQKHQLADTRRFFRENKIAPPSLYPMVRARLTGINNIPIDLSSLSDPRARRLLQREQNLSWRREMQTDNRIIAGQWWSEETHGQPQLSLEQGIAKRLGIKLGDTIQFSVVGEPLSLTVTSLRSVDWDSFNVNFFMVTPPGVLENFPASFITSFLLPPGEPGVLSRLVKRFPNFTVIDISALMTKVRSIMDRVTVAVEFVFLFTLAAGITVLLAAIQATQDERRYEGAILRTLGASRSQLMQGIAAEFATLGMLAGLLAAFSASAVGYVLAQQVFHLTYRPGIELWVVGVLGGALGIGIAGTLGVRSVVNQPPMKTLQRI